MKLDPISAEKEKKEIAEMEQKLKNIETAPIQASFEKKLSNNASDDYIEDFDGDDISEDIPAPEVEDYIEDKQANSQSQSIGMDPSVTSLDIEGYDYVERVQLIDNV